MHNQYLKIMLHQGNQNKIIIHCNENVKIIFN